MDIAHTDSSKTNNHNTINKLIHNPYTAIIIAVVGGILCLVQLYVYSRTQVSVLDEGAYLYKGFLFLRGDYSIYQDYGPWSNHMPLSFFIPGFMQYLFGPGIDVGRNFSITLTLLMLVGLWVVARRFSGNWWAALVVWIFAINPAVLKIYSIAVPQSLVVCMLVWTLVLVLGEDRPLWQLILGSLLSGLMVMTRINMLPVLPLMVLYIIWQHGFMSGLISGSVSLITLVIGHALFWPEILKMWALQLPRSILPVLDPYRSPVDKTPIWNPEVSLRSRLLSFLHALRIHFVVITGVIAALLLWPKKSNWPNSGAFKAVMFLLSLFVVLLGIHFWAALFQNYCVFCLSGYLAYFGVTGLLILIITIPYWTKDQPGWKQILIAIFILMITTAVSFSSFEDTDQFLLNTPIPKFLLDFPDFTPGSVTIDKILINKFHLEFALLRRLVPALAGLFLGILVLFLGLGVNWYYKKRKKTSSAVGQPSTSPAYWSLIVLLVIGGLLSPTIFLGGARSSSECSEDVVYSYKGVGEYLAETIPAGSRTFWYGGLSVAPLLYATELNIYPPQINDGYSYFLSGDPQGLYQFGYWSKDLAKTWMSEADYLLVEERSFHGWWRDDIEGGNFEELQPTPLQIQCRDNSWIHIFKRKQ